jgi:hypothetical protein
MSLYVYHNFHISNRQNGNTYCINFFLKIDNSEILHFSSAGKRANLEIRWILSRELYATLFVVFHFHMTRRSIARIVVAKISPDGAFLLATREHTN